MQTSQGYTLQALQSVQRFLDDDRPSLKAVNETGARRWFDDVVAQLAGYAVSQSGNTLGARASTQTVHAMRRALVRDHIAPLVAIARMRLTDVEELAVFRLPSGMPPVEQLAQQARGIGVAAAPHAAVFIEAGLP